MEIPIDILNDCKKGQRKAQKYVYEVMASKLLAVARRYVNYLPDAEDILQDSFIKIFQKINSFENGTNFWLWSKRIVVNTSIDFYRKEAKLIWPITIEQAYDLEDANENAIDKMSINELYLLLDELPPGCKLVFNLIAIEGYKHTEVAQLLGVTEGTSKSQFARARTILQNKLLTLNITKHG